MDIALRIVEQGASVIAPGGGAAQGGGEGGRHPTAVQFGGHMCQ